jgi:hypothetical protein
LVGFESGGIVISLRKILSCLALLVGVLFSDSSFANPCASGACLELRLLASNAWSTHSCAAPGQLGNQYISVNQKRYQFYSRRFDNGRKDWILNLVIQEDEFFTEGFNSLNLELSSVLDGTTIPAPANYELIYWSRRGQTRLLCAGGTAGGFNQVAPCTNLQMGIHDIDPDVANEIAALKAEIAEYERQANEPTQNELRYRAEEQAFKNEKAQIEERLNRLNQELSRINFGDFESITIDQLAELITEEPTLRQKYEELKNAVNGLKSEIRSEIDRNVQQTQAAQEQVRHLFGEERWSPDPTEASRDQNADFAQQYPTGARGAGFRGSGPGNQPRHSASSNQNAVFQMADQTIEQLNTAHANGDARAFQSALSVWNRYQNNLSTTLNRNPNSSTSLLDGLRMAQQKVLRTVDQSFDHYGFFQRARIPENVKRIVGTLLKDWDENLSKDLKDELNTWQDNLNPVQERVVEMIASLDPVLRKFADPRLQNENPDPTQESVRNIAQVALREGTESLIKAAREAAYDGQVPSEGENEDRELTSAEEYLVQAETGIKVALGFADFVLGFTPAGSVKDLIEAATGISVVANPGAKLEMSERALLTVTGVAGCVTFGGSNVISKAFKTAVGKLAKIWRGSRVKRGSQVVQQAEKILDSAGKIGGFDLKVFEVAKKYLPELKQLRNEYIKDCTEIREVISKMSASKSKEEIAKVVYQLRRDFGIKYKNMTPQELVDFIYSRNIKEYKDHLGPSFETLVEKYQKSGLSGDHLWSKIIEKAQEPNKKLSDFINSLK